MTQNSSRSFANSLLRTEALYVLIVFAAVPLLRCQDAPAFLSGGVITQDGMPPPAIVRVELLCLGAVRQEAYTDSAGRFHFHLGKLDAAEQSAEEARRQDPSRRVPEIEYVLGLVQARKRNYAAAGQHMRTYLQHVVSSVAVDAVKRQLAEIEMLAGQFQEFDARPDRPPVRPLAPAR